MKNLILLLVVLCLMVSVGWAETKPFKMDVNVECDYYRSVLTTIVIDYKEVLVFEGQRANDSFSSLYLNEETGSWTIITFDDQKMFACVFSHGIGLDFP